MELTKSLTPKIKWLIYASSLVVGAAIVIIGYRSASLSFIFHSYLALGLAVGLLAPSIILHLEERRKKLIDNAWPLLLENLAGSQEAGMTLLQALEDASHRKYGPITVELKKLTAQLTWGMEFEKAFIDFSKRIGTEFSTRISILIFEAVRLGGDLKASFNSTAEFVREMIKLRDERESQLRSYLMVIYVSFFVFVAVIVLLYQSFFVPMSKTPTSFLRLTMSLEGYKSLLFDLSIVEAIFGGLVAGKLSEGSMMNGLKHSVILLAVVTLIFTFFLS
jgi:flagellar protein FlaJ